MVIEKDIRCATLDDLQNPKYVYILFHQFNFRFLMLQNFSISDVQTIVRRKLNLNKEQGLYLLVNDGKNLLVSNSSLKEMFEKFKDDDGFLYILYTEENMYG